MRALLQNLSGGEQPAELNFTLLAKQAAYFQSQGNTELARLAADQALVFRSKIRTNLSPSRGDFERLIHTIRATDSSTSRSLKSQWGTSFPSFRSQASLFALALLSAAALISGELSLHRGGAGRLSVETAVGTINTGGTESPRNRADSDPPAFLEPAKPMPVTGQLRTRTNRSPQHFLAPLHVVTAANGPSCLIKLKEYGSRRMVNYFVRSGEVLSVRVPLGSYQLSYAAGEVWYGLRYLFGPDTIFRKAESQLDFQRKGDGFVGYTVELIQQIGGNLREALISRAEFCADPLERPNLVNGESSNPEECATRPSAGEP